MNNNANKIMAICAALESFTDVNGKSGKEVAAKIDSLFKRTLIRSANLELEQLPDNVRRQIQCTIGEPTLTLSLANEYQLQSAA